MRTIYQWAIIALTTLLIISCNKEDIKDKNNEDTFENLYKIASQDFENHSLEIFSTEKHLNTGYNSLYFRFISKEDGDYFIPENFDWAPVMYMHGMSHGAPSGENLIKVKPYQYLENYAIFQMASEGEDYWVLSLEYEWKERNYSFEKEITVKQNTRQRVSVFDGNDNQSYILALIEPKNPKIGINIIKTALYSSEDMHHFFPVENYTLKIDPRMPSMGNHSSPDNEDLIHENNGIYKGKINFSMTGYWKLNFQIINTEDEVIKGEEITEDNPSSTVYLEVEF